MKVIDILNKIANNEELPLRIKVNGYEYRISNGQYYSDEKYMYLVDSSSSISHLNDEVEIIEEDKKIEKLTYAFLPSTNQKLKVVKDKINEIIDYINEGDDKE